MRQLRNTGIEMIKDFTLWFRDPSATILLVLVILGVMGAWSYAEETPGVDYYVAWVAAASPFLYWVVNVFSSGDYAVDLTRWHAISLTYADHRCPCFLPFNRVSRDGFPGDFVTHTGMDGAPSI